jgi:hypothetical protein
VLCTASRMPAHIKAGDAAMTLKHHELMPNNSPSKAMLLRANC